MELNIICEDATSIGTPVNNNINNNMHDNRNDVMMKK